MAQKSNNSRLGAVSPVPLIPKPRSPSRSKSWKSRHNNNNNNNNTQDQLAKYIDNNNNNNNEHKNSQSRDDSNFGGFPDTKTKAKAKGSHKRDSKMSNTNFLVKQLEYSNTYYLEVGDNPEMSYSYFHSRIKDKLVWYQDIEKLLPPTIPGQFIYAALNLLFPSNLYYSFHRYSFDDDDGFKTEHRMDDFFTSRRVLSIQEKCPAIFPSLLWYKIIKYEPTPYKSMSYYQYIREADANHIYKLPLIFGYAHMILISVAIFLFCERIPDSVQFFNFNINISSISQLFLFEPFSMMNCLCYAIIIALLLHILCILIVWRITYLLHLKIYDYKKRIFVYLSRRRAKEIQFIESLFVGNKEKIHRESKYRIYYKINSQSYLYWKRNGELFISLLKWLNVIEYEQDLDFFITSKKNWVIITFALHKYVGLLIFTFIILCGLNIITIFMIAIFIISYWVHCIELYTSDHHNIESKVNQEYNKNTSNGTCFTIGRIVKILLWPGCLIYITLSYCIYIILFHTEYFPVIWLGVSAIWLIVYSVLTRGYRRIFIPNGLSLFFIYFFSINWFIFRNLFNILAIKHEHHKAAYQIYIFIFRYFAAVCLVLFLFSFYISMQLEIHRAMLFPQLSREYKMDETVQHKFGLDVTGAKLYMFAQYAATYFKKNVRYPNYRHFNQNSKDDFFGDPGFEDKWYNRWYFKLPIKVILFATPRYPFVTPTHTS